jgi:hypothetical protein
LAMVYENRSPRCLEQRPAHARDVSVGSMGHKSPHEIGAMEIARSFAGTQKNSDDLPPETCHPLRIRHSI